MKELEFVFSQRQTFNTMNEKDILFKEATDDDLKNHRDFCYFGWEGTGSFALWRYAQAYYQSAEVLFDKFKISSGYYSILDNTGITMCFLYRHYVELSIKYLFFKFVCQTEQEFKEFLEKGHNLSDLWRETMPKLSELKKRVGSSVNLGVLEHYIMEFHRFDLDSEAMRYPFNKDLVPMKEQMRLNIYNLHDRMLELYWAFEGIDGDLDNQLHQEVNQDKIDAFLSKYDELRDKTYWFIETMKSYSVEDSEDFSAEDVIYNKKIPKACTKMMTFYNSCTDDELIMFDTLYYTGREISSGGLNLPKGPNKAKTDAVKRCILNMERDQLEFGKPKNTQINIYCKAASSIVEYVSKTVSIIDWDR